MKINDVRQSFPILWTTDHDSAETILDATSENEGLLAIVISPDADTLGANGDVSECWLFAQDDLDEIDQETILAQGTRILPEEGSFFSSENWCHENGLWEEEVR